MSLIIILKKKKKICNGAMLTHQICIRWKWLIFWETCKNLLFDKQNFKNKIYLFVTKSLIIKTRKKLLLNF